MKPDDLEISEYSPSNEAMRICVVTETYPPEVNGVARTIADISKYITLHPGDVVWMGTDEPTLDMVPGDVVEVEINGLGVLRNPVVAEK